MNGFAWDFVPELYPGKRPNYYILMMIRITVRIELKQVSATNWPRTKSWDISLDCHIGKYRGVIRSKIVFLRISNISAPCPHAQLRGRTVIKKLWTFGTMGSGSLSVTAMLEFCRVKQIHQSTASERSARKSLSDCLVYHSVSVSWMLSHRFFSNEMTES